MHALCLLSSTCNPACVYLFLSLGSPLGPRSPSALYQGSASCSFSLSTTRGQLARLRLSLGPACTNLSTLNPLLVRWFPLSSLHPRCLPASRAAACVFSCVGAVTRVGGVVIALQIRANVVSFIAVCTVVIDKVSALRTVARSPNARCN